MKFLVLLAIVGCYQPPPPLPAASVVVPAPVPVVKRDVLPPDGQILRDLEPRMKCEAFELQARFQEPVIKVKVLDKYDHGAAGVVVSVKGTGIRITYTLAYRSHGNFWRLWSIASEDENGITVARRCQ